MTPLRRLWPQHGLWQHADFLKLWSAQMISQVGSQISGLVLPLVALLTLHASAFEVAVLSVVDFLPFLLFTLPAGVWVDRLPRRPIMVIADVGRSLALVSIPVAVFVGVLTLSQLYVVGFATGTLTVFFEVAYQSYLPSLVERSELLEGNAKLETTRALALTGGPALGGVLVHALTAPHAVLADAASFLWSAVFVSSIRRNEVAPDRGTASPSTWRELSEGVRYIFGHQYWCAITVATAIYNFFNYVAFAILVVYMVRRLHMSALAIGVTLSLSNCGALLAAFFAQRIGRRLGLGRDCAFDLLWFPARARSACPRLLSDPLHHPRLHAGGVRRSALHRKHGQLDSGAHTRAAFGTSQCVAAVRRMGDDPARRAGQRRFGVMDRASPDVVRRHPRLRALDDTDSPVADQARHVAANPIRRGDLDLRA